MTIPNGYRLRRHHGRLADPRRRIAYEALMRDVLGLEPETATDASWAPFSLFDQEGRCVASVDAGLLSLVVDGATIPCAGIRSVAVAADWRGHGLFRALMGEALTWCDRQGATLVLLYTAEPALYVRFGFAPVVQHAFLGPAPAVGSHAPDIPSKLVSPSHPAPLVPLLARRAPISLHAALLTGPALFLSNIAKDEAPALAFAPSLDTAVAFEEDCDTLVIADIVAREIPLLPALLGALRKTPARIKTLFPPDRLGWGGDPVREDTGLMLRGPLPEAMARPFMFPPTAEF